MNLNIRMKRNKHTSYSQNKNKRVWLKKQNRKNYYKKKMIQIQLVIFFKVKY